jgi:hypothetical protein
MVVTRSVLADFVPFDRDQGSISELENADFLMRIELVKHEERLDDKSKQFVGRKSDSAFRRMYRALVEGAIALSPYAG